MSDKYNQDNVMPCVLLLIGDRTVSGPVKGGFQLMETLPKFPGKYILINCLTTRADAGELMSEAMARGIRIKTVIHNSRSYFRLISSVEQLCRNDQVDIIQTHGYKLSFVGFVLKKRMKLKWICFLHGTTTENLKARLYHVIDNLLQCFADKTVIVSLAQRRKVLGGSNRDRVRVIHNAIDPDHPVRKSSHQIDAKKLFAAKNSNHLFAVVGRLSREKGVDIFLKAFHLVNKKKPDTRAVIVGDGPDLDRLKKLQKQLDLSRQVVFAGFTTTPGDYIGAADTLVLPSRSEGIPNVALEAMAFGKVVIATAVGGTVEIIQHEKNGILVPAESVEKLAEAMIRVINDPDSAVQLAQKGKKRVCESFSVKKRVQTIRLLYQEILE